MGALGAEVDRLETEIRQIMPSIRHIDLVSALLPLAPRLPSPIFPATAMFPCLPRASLWNLSASLHSLDVCWLAKTRFEASQMGCTGCTIKNCTALSCSIQESA